MRKNIFTKTMLRQPLRTAVLVLLIALAAFAFVLRTVEYQIVRNQILSIAESYRTIGFINHPNILGDVSEGAAILTQSPYVAQEDYRRAAEGFLVDMLNADFIGMHSQVNGIRSARLNQQRITETYFIAYLTNVEETMWEIPMEYEGGVRFLTSRATVLQMEICYVLVGHPEYAIEGQTVYLYILRNFENYINALYNIEIGQRYLIRGAYVREYPWGTRGRHIRTPGLGPTPPIIGSAANRLLLWPLYEDGHVYEQVWFHPVPDGYEIDFNLSHLTHILGEIEMLDRDHRSIQLQATTDMTIMPEIDRTIRLHRGRLIDNNDYLSASPVAVIDNTFARARGLTIGSTFTVTVPRHQYFVGRVGIRSFMAPLIRTDRNYPYRFYEAHEIELEVVGITMFDEVTRYTAQSLFVFIPDSVLPQDVGAYWRRWGWGYLPGNDGELVQGRVELPTIQLGYDYIPDIWYSFVLADARYEGQFYDDYHLVLYELGMDLVMYMVDSSNFWLSAAPILLTITFNLVLFMTVFMLVLGLVTFLYLRQKRREIAIMRAVGRSIKRVMVQLIVTAILFGVPAIAIGGSTAWHFALSEAESTLQMFEDTYFDAIQLTGFELRWQETFGDRPIPGGREIGIHVDFTIEMDMHRLGIMLAVVLILMIIMIFVGGMRISRLPVLVQLQGEVNTPSKKMAKTKYRDSSDIVAPALTDFVYLPVGPVSRSTKARFLSIFRYIRRHIARSPIKTILGLAVTLFFVITLGWLQESIDRTQSEIDRLHDTTFIAGEILLNPMSTSDRHINDIIRPVTVSRLLNTGYIYSAAFETGYEEAFVVPMHNGTLHRGWQGFVGYHWYRAASDRGLVQAGYMRPFNYLLGVNNIDMFMQAHTIAAAGRTFADITDFDVHEMEERAVGLRNIAIEYAAGFCGDIFSMVYTPGEVVPIVVSSNTLQQRGLALGEGAVLVFRAGRRSFSHIYVVIAGVHNRQIHRDNMQDAVLVPLTALEHYLWQMHYISMDFTINPAYNRELSRIREDFELILNPGFGWHDVELEVLGNLPLLSIFIYDREFNSIISSLEQSMLLLELLYPIAVGLALIIGAGVALLITLQGTKNAAIMRVLGASRLKACIVAWAEQIILCLLGLGVGVAVLIVMGRGIDMVLMLSGMYLAGVAFGSLVGAIIITVKAPIEHLQVRE